MSDQIFKQKDQPINLNQNQTNDSNLKKIEQQKFATYNPLLSDNIRFKRMYWTSGQEKTGRIMMLIVAILLLILNAFVAALIINNMLIKLNVITTGSNFKSWYTILIILIATFGFNFFIFLPIAIARTASAIFSWSIFFIVLAIGYFILIETLYIILLVVNSLVEPATVRLIPYFMILSLILAVVWIIAGCLLLVKSDDVVKQLSVE